MRLPHLPLALFLGLAACNGGSGSSSGGAPGGSTADGGTGGNGSTGEGTATPAAPAAGALPATTFLFTRKTSASTESLVAYDVVTKQSRVVTDLREGTVAGWDIWGVAISPDRTRIALASSYGATKEDNDTKIATRRLWSIAPDGTDFRRITPVFENTGGGKTNFNIDIANPAFTRDGASLYFQYGEYWYEGTTLKGGSQLWTVGAQGGTLPQYAAQPPCSVLRPAVDPKTGRVLAVHSVCVPPAQDGLYLYPEGGGVPELLVPEGVVEPWLETPSWASDGTGFLFIGDKDVASETGTRRARGIFSYDMVSKEVEEVLVPTDENVTIRSVAVAPDNKSFVYCLESGETTNLHRIDLSVMPVTDTALTEDGVSCNPTW